MRRKKFPLLVTPLLFAAAHALAGSPTTWHSAPHWGHAASPCEAARLSAWFDGQRQLTDGNVNPDRMLVTPPECMQLGAHAESAPEKDARSSAPSKAKPTVGLADMQNGA
jgi:hypothetical protein